MKLLLISGPPASGKLTVGQELQKITGFKLYHNHLAHDLVVSLFDHEKYRRMILEINLIMLSRAFEERVEGIISTNCYKSEDAWYIDELKNLAGRLEGSISFVHLSCRREELLKRVSSESRGKFGKITHQDVLDVLLETRNFSIPSDNAFIIDNSEISAKSAALMIQEYFGANLLKGINS